ncbi:MAG TPA: hypothetical protein VK486_06800 [Thermoleophilaceae bacterium]|nr:hypothetical protein [Thermoleophilaceae bacterium]
MSRPGDLQGLPWPEGEPGPLRAAAARLRGLSNGFDGASSTIAAASPTAWSGVASVSYGTTLARAGEAVTYLEGSLDTAGTALGDLADRIDEAQDKVRRAADRLREAREEAADAQRRAAAARTEAINARNSALLNPSPLTFADPFSQAADAAEARAASAEGLAADKQADSDRMERWAQGEASDAVKSVKVADAATASALEATGLPMGPSVGGPPTASGAQAVWDFVYDVALKPFNPYDSGNNAGETAMVFGGYGSGILFGTSEWTSRYASQNWMRYEPGYWARAPRWVAPYLRSTPSGGITSVSGYTRGGIWAPAEPVPDMTARAQWAGRAKLFGRAGTAAAFITAGAAQYFDDQGNPNLNTPERVGRVGAQSVTVGGAAALGGWGGAVGGAAIGTAICPGVGTVVGGVVGGIVGGGLAGGVVDHFNDSVVNWAGTAADDTWDWTTNAASDVSDWTSGAADYTGDKVDSVTPWDGVAPW